MAPPPGEVLESCVGQLCQQFGLNQREKEHRKQLRLVLTTILDHLKKPAPGG